VRAGPPHGRSPKDFDIATNATPPDVLRLYPQSLTVGAQFGVVVVPRSEGHFEVATFRSDDRYTDGRRPSEVHYARPRRKMFAAGTSRSRAVAGPGGGEVLDFVGGRETFRSTTFAPLVTRTKDSARIGCGCSAPYALRLGSSSH